MYGKRERERERERETVIERCTYFYFAYSTHHCHNVPEPKEGTDACVGCSRVVQPVDQLAVRQAAAKVCKRRIVGTIMLDKA